MANGVLGDYDENADNGSGILPTMRRGGSFSDRLMSPMVMFGLGLASGKTPQEGVGNAAKLGFQGAQYQQQRQAQSDTALALAKMGLDPALAKVAGNNPDLLKYLA